MLIKLPIIYELDGADELSEILNEDISVEDTLINTDDIKACIPRGEYTMIVVDSVAGVDYFETHLSIAQIEKVINRSRIFVTKN